MTVPSRVVLLLVTLKAFSSERHHHSLLYILLFSVHSALTVECSYESNGIFLQVFFFPHLACEVSFKLKLFLYFIFSTIPV